MPKRTYKTEQSGPQSTNRFVQRPSIPTTIVTGATTAPVKLTSTPTRLPGYNSSEDNAGGTPPSAGSVGSFGQFVGAIATGPFLSMWGSEMGLFGEEAQKAGRSTRGSIAKTVDEAVDTLRGDKQTQQEQTLNSRGPAPSISPEVAQQIGYDPGGNDSAGGDPDGMGVDTESATI